MNAPNFQRKELSFFLKENPGRWEVGLIRSFQRILESCHCSTLTLEMTLVDSDKLREGFRDPHRPKLPQMEWRIFALDPADFVIRPANPASAGERALIKFSIDDPRLADPRLQLTGRNGEVFAPPRRYQLLELDQSWIFAVRFEIEPLQEGKAP